jgi:hypothetical protein
MSQYLCVDIELSFVDRVCVYVCVVCVCVWRANPSNDELINLLLPSLSPFINNGDGIYLVSFIIEQIKKNVGLLIVQVIIFYIYITNIINILVFFIIL